MTDDHIDKKRQSALELLTHLSGQSALMFVEQTNILETRLREAVGVLENIACLNEDFGKTLPKLSREELVDKITASTSLARKFIERLNQGARG